MRNDPTGTSRIGIHYGQWQHPRPSLLLTVDSLDLTEGSTAQYGLSLHNPPTSPPTVRVISSSPEDLQIVGAGPEGVLQLQFDR